MKLLGMTLTSLDMSRALTAGPSFIRACANGGSRADDGTRLQRRLERARDCGSYIAATGQGIG